MENTFSEILKLFYWAGLFQGAILIIALLKRSILKTLANRLLLALLVAIAVILLVFLSWTTDIISLPRELNSLVLLSWFCVSPLFYLYVRARFERGFGIRANHLVYFSLPFFSIYGLIIQWTNLPLGIHHLLPDWLVYDQLLSGLYTIHNVIFAALSIKCLRAHAAGEVFMRRFFYAFIAASIFFFVNGLIFANAHCNVFVQQVLIIFFSAFVQYVGIVAVRHSPQLRVVDSKYQNVRLSKVEQDKLAMDLVRMMSDEKLYLNPDLSLSELANKLGVQENALSKLFSEHFRTGFYEFLRKYRLLEFENRIQEPKYRQQKIAAVAMDSGFRSRTTFYEAFKEKHGISPTYYLKRIMSDNS